MALLSALLAFVVSVALMAAGSLFLLNETRLGESAVTQARAAGEAERGIAEALEGWSEGGAIPLGDSVFLVKRGPVGLLVRLEPVRFPEFGLISGGSVALAPGARIEGPVDSGATGSRLVGDLDLGRVAASADVELAGGPLRLAPSDTAGLSHAPVVHVRGDAEAGSGDGFGVLLVDGDFLIDGPFNFSGVVVVGGELVVSGSGTAKSHLSGSVATFVRATGDTSLWVTYSKPIIDNALSRFGTPKKLRSRAWVHLF